MSEVEFNERRRQEDTIHLDKGVPILGLWGGLVTIIGLVFGGGMIYSEIKNAAILIQKTNEKVERLEENQVQYEILRAATEENRRRIEQLEKNDKRIYDKIDENHNGKH